ncbi:MAG: nickel pincer cofactor biosynthesis protein LarC [Acidobacteria bacterium]|nr:nickel pincer cofactor biosynthesis protein LarC [Acidobacteriota bacterium]
MNTDRVLYIDAQSGISGDMMIGALLDLGGSLERLQAELRSIALHGYRLSSRRVLRAGILSTKFDVESVAEPPARAPEGAHGDHDHVHRHRSLREIRAMIESSALSDWVKQKSVAVFTRLAEAEGAVHDQPPDEVHFHEVGALDSIIDIVGCMILLESLLPVKIFCSPVNLGQGTLECRHGIYPVPGPAVERLLHGVPTYSNSVAGELTTPTGAALLVTLVDSYGPRPIMTTRATGYGAGAREIPGCANVLRLTLADAVSPGSRPGGDEVAVVEAAIDDMSPQIWGYFQERALAAGALDVYATPVQMKKNRPAIQLTLLCDPALLEEMLALIFTETTTIGVRHTVARRRTLDRSLEQVHTDYGTVRIKTAYLGGRCVNFLPEYEDCQRIAAERGVALKEVLAAATRAFLNSRNA